MDILCHFGKLSSHRIKANLSRLCVHTGKKAAISGIMQQGELASLSFFSLAFFTFSFNMACKRNVDVACADEVQPMVGCSKGHRHWEKTYNVSIQLQTPSFIYLYFSFSVVAIYFSCVGGFSFFPNVMLRTLCRQQFINTPPLAVPCGIIAACSFCNWILFIVHQSRKQQQLDNMWVHSIIL